ncbi:DUF1819 family protein [Rubellimicrobium rubrum]|nr:DUF1819 family protein [Rubellimicrobium rubrum]
MSFSTGGLFVNESVELAGLHITGENWSRTILRALEHGATSLPKAASNRRTLREIGNRVSTLTDTEREFLVWGADRPEREALLWLATCRAYRFIREFAIEVIQDRFLSYRLELPLEAFDQFFEAKAEWDEGLAGLSVTTRVKLRQVLFRIMREAGILDTSDHIRPALLSPRLTQLIVARRPEDLLCFPGQRLETALS